MKRTSVLVQPNRMCVFLANILTILAMLLATSFSARADGHLFVDDIEENASKIDPRTGKPLFELKPTWLTPTSAVHEDMLKESFNLSNIYNRVWDDRATANSDETSYIKGVYWNDSPERGLCRWCPFPDNNMRAFEWYTRFKAAESAADKGAIFTHASPILERSHFGDLVFMHGMASGNGFPPAETQRLMLIWAEFTYKVATGKISGLTKIRDVKIESFSDVFNAQDTDVYDRDMRALFSDPHDATMFIDVRRIAMGSLLHLIEDSYSPAHVQRVYLDTAEGRFCRGAIRQFLAYTSQNVQKHSAGDKWPANLPRNALTPDARVCDPITAGAAVLKFYARDDFTGADWAEVRTFFEKSIFALDANAIASGPGEDFKKGARYPPDGRVFVRFWRR